LTTELQPTEVGASVLVGRLKRPMLLEPVALSVEFVNRDGARSNKIFLQVVAESN
jgi:hypothetical protein